MHIAWLLNFNLTLESFERVHDAGVRHLIDLALASPRANSPRFVFSSTISTVANTSFEAGTERIVMEKAIKDERSATLGYGMSKLVGERICEAAAEASGLDVSIVRIGQIS